MNWLYNNKEINSLEDFGENIPFGFIYEVQYIETGKKYIGKKVLFFTKTKKLGKKELVILKEQRKNTPGRVPTTIQVTFESDWKSYYGSHEELKKLFKSEGEDKFTRKILLLVYNKKHLTYYENKYLFTHSVLESNDYFNNNIENRYFRKDFTE